MRFEFDDEAIEELLGGPEIAEDIAARAGRIAERARGLVDVETGRLRDSIGSDLRRDEQGLVAVAGSDVEYALVQELNEPYLRPAIDAGQ
jgi:hypothetical protein